MITETGTDSHEQGRMAYTPAELASLFGLSRRAIYRAIANGEPRAARVCSGSRLLVPAAEVSAWMERNLMEPRTSVVPSRRPPSRIRRGHTPLRDALAGLTAEPGVVP